jgi:hypothetical protein
VQDFLDVAFNTEEEEGSQPFALMPSARYKAEIVKAMAGPTKNGKGYSVTLNWSITEGEYENRTIFQSVLIQHESAEAQKYGRQKFKDITVALGVKGVVEDLSVLLHRPCMIGVIIRQDRNGQYPDRNEIGRVMAIPAHNGATREMIKEAQKPQPAFKAADAAMNDSIPF